MALKNNNSKKIFVIIGPTAIGKSQLALELSKYLPSEIISADSRQIYRYTNIGTAKPTPAELNMVKHHFIDIIEPNEYYSAGNFADDTNLVYNEIINKGKYPILVGGSGLYIKSMVEGFSTKNDISSDTDEIQKIRINLESLLKSYGKNFLHDELSKVDNISAILYNDKNPRRVIRALEYYYSTGIKFSDTFDKNKPNNYEAFYLGLNTSRAVLYNRINARVDEMWQQGLLEETENIIKMGFDKNLNSLNTVGYKETISYLDGFINKEQAIELIKIHTRRYAKRQLTWFKSIENVEWYNFSDINMNILADKIKRFFD